MIKLNKTDFNSKELVESEINKYKSWYNGELNGEPEPIVKKEIKEIVKGQDWEFIDKTKEQIKQEEAEKKELEKKSRYENDLDLWFTEVVRPQRNSLLSQSDVYMLEDYPISEAQRNDLLTYRQQLRDITDSFTEYSESIQWPTKPSFMY
jgi:hypothetical protein